MRCVLQSSGIEVVVTPHMGGRITRLFDSVHGRDWLVPPIGASRAAPVAGSRFADHEMCGWDEMVPTILPCIYPEKGVYSGIELPDHGELWTAKWDVLHLGQDVLVTTVLGKVLPFRLDRTISVSTGRLQLDYELSSVGAMRLRLLWAAHPLFACKPATQLILPPEITEVWDVINPRGRIRVEWPGESLDVVNRLPKGTGRKFYLDPRVVPSWVKLRDAEGTTLTMSFNGKEVPYLGLWLDNGWFSDGPVVGLEPALGFCDELALACELDRVVDLEPLDSIAWSVAVMLGLED